MSETIVQTASLVGQVIEDLTYEPLGPSQFQAELVGVAQAPQYKPGGFFVFSNLALGAYTLRLAGQRFRTFEQSVTIPHPNLLLEVPGSNETFVLVTSADANRMAFDTVLLTQPIRAGAPVIGPAGFSATLAADLDQGRVMEATIEDVVGTLTPGAVGRLIRDRSIRLQFAPLAPLPFVRARLVGTVGRQHAPQIPLYGAHVRLTRVNGVNITAHDVSGVTIGTVTLNGIVVIVGTEQDMATETTLNGDFNLYFSVGDALENVTVEVTLAGYQPETVTTAINAGQRQHIAVQLADV